MKTDAQLQQDVLAELLWDPAVTAAQIGVAVRDGGVTLSGEVSSQAEKWQAEQATQRVGGVKALAVELEVKLSELGRRTDADIETALKRRASHGASGIVVDVHGHDVTLSGPVHGWAERDVASRSASGTPGVRTVIDLMTLVD